MPIQDQEVKVKFKIYRNEDQEEIKNEEQKSRLGKQK